MFLSPSKQIYGKKHLNYFFALTPSFFFKEGVFLIKGSEAPSTSLPHNLSPLIS